MILGIIILLLWIICGYFAVYECIKQEPRIEFYDDETIFFYLISVVLVWPVFLMRPLFSLIGKKIRSHFINKEE